MELSKCEVIEEKTVFDIRIKDTEELYTVNKTEDYLNGYIGWVVYDNNGEEVTDERKPIIVEAVKEQKGGMK